VHHLLLLTPLQLCDIVHGVRQDSMCISNSLAGWAYETV
jgi:hypothetical protein